MELRYPDPPLSDGSVTLRPWLDTDVDCIAAASTDERIPQGTTVPARFTREAGLSFIDRQHGRLTSGQGVSLAICHQSQLAVGLAILMIRPQAGVAGIGYWVVPSARGHGVATRAIGLVTDWGLDHLGFDRIEAWVEPDNVASRRALEANRYEAEGCCAASWYSTSAVSTSWCSPGSRHRTVRDSDPAGGMSSMRRPISIMICRL